MRRAELTTLSVQVTSLHPASFGIKEREPASAGLSDDELVVQKLNKI